MSKKEPSFEDALKRLEEIVRAIEQGKVGLEESIKQFEEGVGLIRRCRQVLSAAELKIQHLQASGSDDVVVSEPSVASAAASQSGAEPFER